MTVFDVRGARPLDPRFSIRRHSPTGFEWGYCGSGPAQLALALVADATDGLAAEQCYQDFKAEVVAGMDRDGWTLTERFIADWVDAWGKRQITDNM